MESADWWARCLTPIVAGDRVFVTSQLGTGVRREGITRVSYKEATRRTPVNVSSVRRARRRRAVERRTVFLVESFNRTNGARLWQHRLAATGTLPGVHDKHNLASPSPVTDGQMVRVVRHRADRGARSERQDGLAATSWAGNFTVRCDLGTRSSPTLFGDLLILLCDHELGCRNSAVDKRTGKERWRADRGKGRMSYSTPLVVNTPGGPG